MKQKIYLIFIYLLLIFKMTNAQKQDSINTKFNNYLDVLFQYYLNNNPEFAASIGMKLNYGKWNERNDKKTRDEFTTIISAVDYIKKNYDVNKLNDASKFSLKLFEEYGNKLQEDYEWRHHDYIINQLEGDHVYLPTFLINIHKIDNENDAKDYILRLKGIEKVLEEDTFFLDNQIKKNIFPPKFTLTYVINDIKNILDGLNYNDEKNILLTDFKTKLENIDISKNNKDEYILSATNALNTNVKNGYNNLLKKIIQIDSLTTTNNGVWGLPNGDLFYNYALKNATTTNLSPDSIYNLGLSEVLRIQKELKIVMNKMNYKKSLFEFFQYLKTDKKFSYSNDDTGRQLLLNKSNEYLSNIYKVIPLYFNTLPVAKCVVLPVEKFREKSSVGAFYEQPSEDGKRPGRFYVNLYNLETEKTYDLEALVYHEAIPGHHMQISIAQELKDIPNFRKYINNDAYCEGWALYSEYLAKEMNLYKKIESEIGRLSMELFRASRLVIDVGIHYKKWTLNEATDYMIKNTLTSKLECKKEVERYFLLPGQATSYKIGMLTILKLRKYAQKELGKKFDIKKFHDVVLKNGAVSLEILELLIKNWVKNENKKIKN